MPRLLMACSTLADGSGMMAAVAPLVGQLRRLGCNVRIIGPSGPGDHPVAGDQLQGARADVLRRIAFAPPQLADAWNTYVAVKTFASAGELSVVHVHGVWTPASAAACFCAQSLGTPYVISPHGMLLPAAFRRGSRKKYLALRAYGRRNLEAAALVHASSEAERDSVLAVAPAARTCIIPWGIDLPVLGHRRGSHAGTRQAAYIGRIIQLKGVDDLLAAWAAVRPPGWALRFVGPDPDGYAKRLEKAIDSTRLCDSVSLLGPLKPKSLRELVQGLDLMILPSHAENFGMAVAEALAAGVPVITTTATPWQGMIQQGCGWWVSDTPEALAAAIREACALPQQVLVAMGARGRDWMSRSFNLPHVALRFETELYRASSSPAH